MAKVVLKFTSDETFGQYLAQLEDAALAANIDDWYVQGHFHILFGEDLPAPTLAFENQHAITVNDENDLETFLIGATLPSIWKVRNKGGKYVIAGLTGQIVSAEAQAVLDRMSDLTAQEEAAIVNFVDAEVAAGNWELTDEFWCFALNDTTSDWLTGFLAHTATLSGAVVRTNNGAELDGTVGQFIQSGFNLLNDSVHLQDENGAIGGFIFRNDDITASGNFNTLFDNGNLQNWALRQRPSALQLQSAAQDTGFSIVFGNGAFQETLYDLHRTGPLAGDRQLFIGGVLASSPGTRAPSAILNANMRIGGGLDNASTFNGVISTMRISASIGFDPITHNANVRTLLLALGVPLPSPDPLNSFNDAYSNDFS